MPYPTVVYYASHGELYVRVNGVKKKLTGTEITSYIQKKFAE
jgi:hypothetical protein